MMNVSSHSPLTIINSPLSIRTCLSLTKVLPQVVVRLVEPVLTGRAEDVYVEGVYERLGLVRDVRRDDEHLARMDDDPIQNFKAPSRT